MKTTARSSKITDFLEREVYPRLAVETAYSHEAHAWKTRSDQKYRGGCPFHQSKSGTSFAVTPGNLLFWCAGCGTGGSAIQYLARLRGMPDPVRGYNFIELARELASMAGVQLPERVRTDEEIAQEHWLAIRAAHLTCMADVSIEHLWSPAGETARSYLTADRGFTKNQIRELRMGLYPGPKIVSNALRKAGLTISHGRDVGVLQEKWKGFITIPWADEYARPLTVYGRYQAKSPPDSRPKTLALPGMETKRSPLYLDRARRDGHSDLVLVEGVLDAAIAQAHGDTRVVACLAAQLSDGQVQTLARSKTKSVTICLDPDGAGDAGTVRCVKALNEVGIEASVAPRLPDGKDPDEFIISNGIDAWRDHINQTTSGSAFLVQHLFEEVVGDEPTEKSLADFLAKAEEQDLALDAAKLVRTRILNEARADDNDAKTVIQDALESAATIDALAILADRERGTFEAFLASLETAGGTGRLTRALKASVNVRKKQRKAEKTENFRAPSSDEPIPLVLPILGGEQREFLLPRGYVVQHGRVFKEHVSKHGDMSLELVSHDPIVITRRFVDIDDREERLLLQWPRDGRPATRLISRGDVASARDLVPHAAFGLPVSSGNAGVASQWLMDFEWVNSSILTPHRVSRHLGWQGDDGKYGFLWGAKLVTKDGIRSADTDSFETDGLEDFVAYQSTAEGERQIADAFFSHGQLGTWKEVIFNVVDYPPVLAALLLSLGTPLLQIINAPNPILSLSSRTSAGKTTALRVAGSVWGNPDETDSRSVVRSWDATRVFIERLSSTLRSLPVLLDETSVAKDKSMIPQALYSITQGQGRGRGSTSGTQRSGSWRTALISTGEQPLTSFSERDGGCHARVIELWGPPFGDQDKHGVVTDLNLGVRSNFGHAGPAFVQYLCQNRDRWSEWRTSFRAYEQDHARRAGGNAVLVRLSRSLAFIRFVAKLASSDHADVLPWSDVDVGAPLVALWDHIEQNAVASDRDAAALQQIHSWSCRNQTRFLGYENTAQNPPNGWAGRWKRGDLYPRAYFPDFLEQKLEEWGFSPAATINAWRDRGWLDAGGPKRLKKQISIDGTRGYFYVLRPRAFEAAIAGTPPNKTSSTEGNQGRSGGETCPDEVDTHFGEGGRANASL